MNSLDLMKKFKKETFDLIFVDGFHKDPKYLKILKIV